MGHRQSQKALSSGSSSVDVLACKQIMHSNCSAEHTASASIISSGRLVLLVFVRSAWVGGSYYCVSQQREVRDRKSCRKGIAGC